MVPIASVLNDLNSDKNIEHVLLSINYYDDEKEISEFLDKNKVRKDSSEEKTEVKQTQKKVIKHNDFICPLCHSNEGLVDKDGKVYPCYSCIQIDVGKRILDNYNKTVKQTVDKNNIIIENKKKEEKTSQMRGKEIKS